jgi:hypothetical protein
MRRLALLAALVLAAPSVVAAQPGATPPQNPDDEVPTGRTPTQPTYQPTYQPAYQYPTYHYETRYALPPPVMPEAKSEGTGVMLALGTTIAGYAMLGSAANHSEGGGSRWPAIDRFGPRPVKTQARRVTR